MSQMSANLRGSDRILSKGLYSATHAQKVDTQKQVPEILKVSSFHSKQVFNRVLVRLSVLTSAKHPSGRTMAGCTAQYPQTLILRGLTLQRLAAPQFEGPSSIYVMSGHTAPRAGV